MAYFDPLIPKGISLKAKRYMRDLIGVMEDKGVNTTLDSAAIQLIGQTYHNYIEATETLKNNEEGMYQTVETQAGSSLKAHPAVKVQLDSQVQLTRLLMEFGLTPKSRGELRKDSEKEDDKASPLTVLFDRKREVI
jgi:P27 family predicted phage terminase small subunit